MWPSNNILQRVFEYLALSQEINTTPDIRAIFGPSLSPDAEVVLRSDLNWTEKVQQRWSAHLAPDYLGAVKVATEEDVQNTVRSCKMLLNIPTTQKHPETSLILVSGQNGDRQ